MGIGFSLVIAGPAAFSAPLVVVIVLVAGVFFGAGYGVFFGVVAGVACGLALRTAVTLHRRHSWSFGPARQMAVAGLVSATAAALTGLALTRFGGGLAHVIGGETGGWLLFVAAPALAAGAAMAACAPVIVRAGLSTTAPAGPQTPGPPTTASPFPT